MPPRPAARPADTPLGKYPMPSLRGLLVGVALLVSCVPAGAADDPKAVEFFEAKIRPVFVEHCQKCHSEPAAKAGKLRGGLRLDSRAGWQAGGDEGPAVVPGKPDAGTLVKSLRYGGDVQMPPAGKLPAAVIADFETWVRDGAADPRDALAAKPAAGIDLDKGRAFWSLTPPTPQAVPGGGAAGNAIDAFLRAKWAENGLTPTATADRVTLARRASFDLTGLPPTPEEVEAFAADTSPDAWAKVIDRLLASPRYGERWGRHWLDVARYAEDQAHTFGVTPKANAYLYRDWVVRAFNDDMPYDRFVRLQVAGDLMPESVGDPFTRLAGLGLMGLGAEYYKNTAREQAIAEELDDRVDTLTRGFLGLTVACARCHDHKFDPVPTRDYYAIAGVYYGTSMTTAPLATPAAVKLYAEAQEQVKAAEAKVTALLNAAGRVASKDAAGRTAGYLVADRATRAAKSKAALNLGLAPHFVRRWAKFLDPANAAKAPPAFKEWFALKPDATPAEVLAVAESLQAALVAVELPDAAVVKGAKPKPADPLGKAVFLDPAAPLFVAPADAEKLFLPDDAKSKLVALRGDVEQLKKASPAAPPAAHVVSGAGQAMSVYIRGNPATKGEAAPKGFLRVLAPAGATPAKDFTRLDLADAIASPGNPLTARVIVNRAWAWHFGRGLVATPSNFGALGERPTHPELLDYLAVEFVRNGWSLKWLHRQILASTAYRLAAGDGDPTADAPNAYLARGTRHRLDVEAWRDSLLFVSGSLDPAVGGPPFDLRDPAARRRTVYARVSRHELDGLLRMFDFPDANATADRRNVTTVPQQQLFALNSEFMVTQAKAFAARAATLGATDAERVTAAYRLAFSRPPEPREAELAAAFLKLPAKPDDKLTRWQQYAQALLASNEMMYAD